MRTKWLSLDLFLSLFLCVCAYPILTRRDDWWTIYYNAQPIIIYIYISALHVTPVAVTCQRGEHGKKKQERKKCFFSWPTRDTAGDCIRTKTFRRRTDAKVSNDAYFRLVVPMVSDTIADPITAVHAQSSGLNVRKSCAFIFSSKAYKLINAFYLLSKRD